MAINLIAISTVFVPLSHSENEWRKTRRTADEDLEKLHEFQTSSVRVNFQNFGEESHYFGQFRLDVLRDSSVPGLLGWGSLRSNFWRAVGRKKRKKGLWWRGCPPGCHPLARIKFYFRACEPGLVTSGPWQVQPVFYSQDISQDLSQDFSGYKAKYPVSKGKAREGLHASNSGSAWERKHFGFLCPKPSPPQV